MAVDARRAALSARRRAYAMELRSMRRTYEQIAAAVLPCDEHRRVGGIEPAQCAELHAFARQVDGPQSHPVDCLPMYANRKGAQRAVLQALAEGYQLTEADKETMRQEQLATSDLVLRKMLTDALTGPTPVDRARAATAVARLLERQARLAGLDAPTRVSIDPELDDAVASALAELSDLPMPTADQLRES